MEYKEIYPWSIWYISGIHWEKYWFWEDEMISRNTEFKCDDLISFCSKFIFWIIFEFFFSLNLWFLWDRMNSNSLWIHTSIRHITNESIIEEITGNDTISYFSSYSRTLLDNIGWSKKIRVWIKSSYIRESWMFLRIWISFFDEFCNTILLWSHNTSPW